MGSSAAVCCAQNRHAIIFEGNATFVFLCRAELSRGQTCESGSLRPLFIRWPESLCASPWEWARLDTLLKPWPRAPLFWTLWRHAQKVPCSVRCRKKSYSRGRAGHKCNMEGPLSTLYRWPNSGHMIRPLITCDPTVDLARPERVSPLRGGAAASYGGSEQGAEWTVSVTEPRGGRFREQKTVWSLVCKQYWRIGSAVLKHWS